MWAIPFIAQGTIFKNVKLPDTHDYDTAWGSTISEVKLDNGTQKKVVIGTDKRGDIMAMDAPLENHCGGQLLELYIEIT